MSFLNYHSPMHLEAISSTLFPAYTSIATNLIIQKIINVAQKRFEWSDGFCAFLSTSSTVVIAPAIVDRIEPLFLGKRGEVDRTTYYVNLATLLVIATIRFYYIDTLQQDTIANLNKTVTPIQTPPKFKPRQSQNAHIKFIEKVHHRPKQSTSMVFVGDESLTQLLLEEYACRLKKDQAGKKLFSIHAEALNKMYDFDFNNLLKSLSKIHDAILVIDRIDRLAENQSELIRASISKGAISVIGTTTPGEAHKIQGVALGRHLTTLEITPLEAGACYEALDKKPSVDEGIYVLATLFSYHHVLKSFVIADAEALLADFFYTYKDRQEWTTDPFLQYWADDYRKSKTKISLASLSEASKTFFDEKGIDIQKFTELVVKLNQHKPDSLLGASEMPSYMSDMIEEAREGKYPPCIGRENEIKKVIQALNQPRNKSLVLLGPPGIGKTAVFEEIARRIALNDPSAARLKEFSFYWVDVNSLTGISGGYVGRLEKAVASMITFCKLRKGKAILVIDELHQLRGAGKYHGNDTDILEMLKNSLARDEIIVLGTANDYRWKPIVDADSALSRRIRPVHMGPPSPDACFKMLKHINDSEFYTKQFAQPLIHVTDEAIQTAITLSEFWMKERFLPDKATVLISAAATKYQHEQEDVKTKLRKDITAREIAIVLYDEIKHTLKPQPSIDEFLATVLKKKQNSSN